MLILIFYIPIRSTNKACYPAINGFYFSFYSGISTTYSALYEMLEIDFITLYFSLLTLVKNLVELVGVPGSCRPPLCH